MSSGQGILDLTSRNFDVDAYVCKLLKEKSLDALVAEEEQMVNCVRRLDSDVHQIVYENYNKFLTATNSVRKIEKEFEQLDSDMHSLHESMSSISTLVQQLSPVIDGKKGQASTLARSFRTVNAVQFVSELPSTIQSLMDEGHYAELVRLHLKAKSSLTPYADMPNVKSVLDRVREIVALAENELHSRLGASASSVEQAGEAISLLSQLGVPDSQLQEKLLEAAEATLRRDLGSLSSTPVDVLELVDAACSSFIPDLALCASLYRDYFPATKDKMLSRLQPLLEELNEFIRKALLSAKPHDTALTVRSLDRFYSKCSAVSQHLPEFSNQRACERLVEEVSAREVKLCRERIVLECNGVLKEVRESLLESDCLLPPLIAKVLGAFLLQIKTALAHLLLFTASDVAFSSAQGSSSSFRTPFARLVYDEILVGANEDACTSCTVSCAAHSQPSLALVLALAAHEWAGKIGQLEILCREQFSISAEEAKGMSKEEQVTSLWRSAAHRLLTQFVHQTAVSIGDGWSNALAVVNTPSQPRGVSLATRRMREEMRALCDTVASVLGEDSSMVISSRLLRSPAPPSGAISATHLLYATTARREPRRERKTVTMPKDSLQESLWSERVDLHAAIHFKKASMVVAVAKGVLKSGVEGVRVNTIGTHALQQIQVDVAYLQESLSVLIGDDPLLTSLFDSLLSSALRRCANPQLLHPNVVTNLITEEEAKS